MCVTTQSSKIHTEHSLSTRVTISLSLCQSVTFLLILSLCLQNAKNVLYITHCKTCLLERTKQKDKNWKSYHYHYHQYHCITVKSLSVMGFWNEWKLHTQHHGLMESQNSWSWTVSIHLLHSHWASEWPGFSSCSPRTHDKPQNKDISTHSTTPPQPLHSYLV